MYLLAARVAAAASTCFYSERVYFSPVGPLYLASSDVQDIPSIHIYLYMELSAIGPFGPLKMTSACPGPLHPELMKSGEELEEEV